MRPIRSYVSFVLFCFFFRVKTTHISSASKSKIEKIDENNDFNLWCIRMRTLVRHKELLSALKNMDALQETLSNK